MSIVIIEESCEIRMEQFLKYIDILGLDRFHSNKTFIIKPNLCAGDKYSSHSGVTTDYRTLENIINIIIHTIPDSEISIVESSSYGGTSATLKFIFQGYDQLCSKHKNVRLIDLSKDELVSRQINGMYLKDAILLPKILFEKCFFISLAKIKTHMLTTITGALKNQFGCLPDLDKIKYHPFINEVIVDINGIIKPDLFILDGNPALEGCGPVKGVPRRMNMILLGKDPVAVDSVMATIMGFNPYKIKTINLAAKANLGQMVLTKIQLVPEEIELNTKVENFKFIALKHKLIIKGGLFIQRVGQDLMQLGHEIHVNTNLLQGIKLILEFIIKEISQTISFRFYSWIRNINRRRITNGLWKK